MELQYGICKVAVAPLRAEPSDRSEITSQLLFGDHVEVIEKTEKWWKISNTYDAYEGWMDFKQLASISATEWEKMNYDSHMAPASLNNIVTGQDGSAYYLSPGSNLPLYQDGYCDLGDEKFKVQFDPKTISAPTQNELITTVRFFQNVPYLWGGRNLYGIDCSGLMQIVFKLNGIKLKRDAWQQAEQGEVVDFLQEVQPGDVAFFDNDQGKITHVGMMLNATEIIHASGKVRVDKMDNQGIYNAELGRYTHKLRIIKRFA